MFWHVRSRRKYTGGLYRKFRDKRKYEKGRYPALTTIGERKFIKIRTKGGGLKIRLYKDLAERIMKPRRIKRAVNLSKIQRYIREGETAIVPYKLLGYGTINKKISVVALSYSKSAKDKIENKGGKIINFLEFIKQSKKPLNVRIFE